MPPQQQQQNAVTDLAKKATQAAQRTADALTKGNPIDTARAMSKLTRTLINANDKVTKLDKAVNDLEKAAPGTSDSVTDLAKTLKELSDLVPKRNVPNGLKPLANDAAAATDSMAKFAQSYQDYKKAPGVGLNPLSWANGRSKATKLNNAVNDWKSFRADYKKLETHAGPLADPKIKGPLTDAANMGLDILDGILK